MKNPYLIIISLIFASCQISENSSVSSGSVGTLPSASTICSGTTVLGVVGTAECSSGLPTTSTICSGTRVLGVDGTAECRGFLFSSFASRKDNASFPVSQADFTAFFATPPDRVVATLADEAEENLIFTDNHSVIPSPLDDSDGRFGMGLSAQDLIDTGRVNDIPQKRNYLETIAAAKMNNDSPGSFTSRQAALSACGESGAIESRISDCVTVNGIWSFYDGKKYGQDGEGDWKLVSVVTGTKYEVWRDERTKLLWSDKTSIDYNWYQAAGYSKNSVISTAESGYDASPGGPNQPPSPISVCPDVAGGVIAAGGGTYTNYAANPETAFKGGLSYTQATWRLPSLNDWQLANVNGIRKVLPNMDYEFWSASSVSFVRDSAWYFNGGVGNVDYNFRDGSFPVRCVAPSRD